MEVLHALARTALKLIFYDSQQTKQLIVSRFDFLLVKNKKKYDTITIFCIFELNSFSTCYLVHKTLNGFKQWYCIFLQNWCPCNHVIPTMKISIKANELIKITQEVRLATGKDRIKYLIFFWLKLPHSLAYHFS